MGERRREPLRRLSLRTVAAVMALTLGFGAVPGWAEGLFPLGATQDVPRLPDTPVPFAKIPPRPALPLELGCKFLGNGDIPKGFELPTGAVWTPCLWVFGTLRTAVQTYESIGAKGRNTEVATRLDLYANLQLSETEKCVVGVAPFDNNQPSHFTRYSFESNTGQEGGRPEFGVYLRTAFCEGDFGSLFPDLDKKGTHAIDYGFAFGRQQTTYQNGIMISDVMDTVGIVRNNLHAPGFSNIRVTALWGIDDINRGDPSTSQRLDSPGLYGLFTEADTFASTYNLDVATIRDHANRATGGNSWNVGFATTQRGLLPGFLGGNGNGEINTAYRINVSQNEGADTPQASDGYLLSEELSFSPESSADVVYFNSFWGIDRFTQMARDPIQSGPLAPLGISFAGVGLGDFSSALSSTNTQVVGIATGYQAFWDNHRRNLTMELAAVKDTTRGLFSVRGPGTDGAALTAQFQQALGQRYLWSALGFVSYNEGRGIGTGARTEIEVQF